MMSQSITETIAMLPDGGSADAVPITGVASYIFNNYVKRDEETARRAAAQNRTDLYNDLGDELMMGLIDKVFTDADVKRLRKHWVQFAKFNNPTKRIINELATVYQSKATRRVDGDQNNAIYQKVIAASRQDEVFSQVNAMLLLHRAIFVRPRVRVVSKTHREPAIDIATPADAYAIRHPLDPTYCVAVVIVTGYYGSSSLDDRFPAFEVWTDHEKFLLNSSGAVIPGSHIPHGLGSNPWLFLTIDPPQKEIWPRGSGADLVAGHLAIWFANIQMLKETKSLNRQQIMTGDLTTGARGQVAESEMPVELPDGATIQTVDMGVDTKQYRENANHILEQMANNYGISAGVLHHQGVQSAEARELMRAPIKEQRMQQIKVFREFEQRFVIMQSIVMSSDHRDMAFSPDGFMVKFGEVRTPLSPKESLEVFEKARTLGVTNTERYLMDEHGLTSMQARQWIAENVAVELVRNELLRPLAEINGTMAAENSSGKTPQENGAQSQINNEEELDNG